MPVRAVLAAGPLERWRRRRRAALRCAFVAGTERAMGQDITSTGRILSHWAPTLGSLLWGGMGQTSGEGLNTGRATCIAK
eukprot:7237221-Prymnesium_polylepis.1